MLQFAHDDIVSDACASYATLESVNHKLRPVLQEVTQTLDYYGYYRLNLYGKECPFWSDDTGVCGNIACAVNTIDDEAHIPPIWRSAELGKLSGPKASQPRKVNKGEPSPLGGQLGEGKGETCIFESDECDERDYCIPEDEGSKGEYVSLKDNPERFTGYAGTGANNVWEAIYRENCFPRKEQLEDTTGGQSRMPFSPFGAAPKEQVIAANNLKGVVQDKTKHELVKTDGGAKLQDLNLEEECLEKRVFYKLVSGMHASISMHLCWDYLNQTTGTWGPNLDCYISRFQNYPSRLQNIYFNYALLLRAVSKLQTYFSTYTFCSLDPSLDRTTKSLTLQLSRTASITPPVFDESLMFLDPSTPQLKEDFRNRFRNVSRIMDCVGCDKCRLWGKVQTQGYGTALKVLFEFDENKGVDGNPPLRRTEVVALVNTLARVSTSIHAAEGFAEMLEARLAAEDSARKAAARKARAAQREAQSVADVFWEEMDLVWQAYMHVVRAWWEFPGVLWTVVKTEAKRAGQAFLGIGIDGRKYAWRRAEFKLTKGAVKDEL